MYDTLVLSGGAMNGLIQLGSLQYCKDNNMIEHIQTYIGTSVGAIICYLLIIGYTPIEITVYLCTHTKVFDKLKYLDINAACRGDGATSFFHIMEYIEQMTTEKIGRIVTMKDLPILFNKKLICTTYNSSKNTMEYLSAENTPDLPCLTALRMSANIPLVFENYKYGGNFYVDGGICNNFPIDIGEQNGERVLGLVSLLLSNGQLSSDIHQKNFAEYILRLLYVSFETTTRLRITHKRENTTIIQLEITDYSSSLKFNLESKNKLEMFSSGYNQASLYFSKLNSE